MDDILINIEDIKISSNCESWSIWKKKKQYGRGFIVVVSNIIDNFGYAITSYTKLNALQKKKDITELKNNTVYLADMHLYEKVNL